MKLKAHFHGFARTLLVLVFFFTACSNDKIVTQMYKEIKIGQVDSIKLLSSYPDIQERVEDALRAKNLKLNNDSHYAIKVDYMNYEKICNNPMTSAYDATYTGFIRLTFLKNNQRIYMCQKEFRGELSVGGLEKLLTLMRDDLEF